MSGLRFKVGELAVFVVPVTLGGIARIGQIVEILAAGPFAQGQETTPGYYTLVDCDYSVQFPGHHKPAGAYDFQLRKLDPPAEPASLIRELREEEPA